MKTIEYISVMLSAWLLLLSGGCSADEFNAGSDRAEDVSFDIVLPGFDSVALGTRASESGIDNLKVFFYNADGNCTDSREVGSDLTQVSGKYSLKLKLRAGTASLQFVANASPENTSVLSGAFVTDRDANVMWGRISVAEIKAGNTEVKLIRNYAKVSVKKTEKDFYGDFELTQFAVCATSFSGSIAPADGNISGNIVSAPTLPDSPDYTHMEKLGDASRSVRVYETAAGNGKIIIEGKYAGSSEVSYYVAAFRTRQGEGVSENPNPDITYSEDLPILRNHSYTLEITGVRSEGWKTFGEALKAEPDNRISLLITEKEDVIDDVIASRDYALGVESRIRVDCEGKRRWNGTEWDQNIVAHIVSSYKGENVRLTVSGDADWVTVPDNVAGTETSEMATDKSEWTAYDVTLTVKENQKPEERIAEITVRSGDLTRTITLVQDKRDYIRDDRRKVLITIAGNADIQDKPYFSWLDTEVKGVRSEDFYQTETAESRQTRRDDGLIFPALAKSQTITYKIPKIAALDINAGITSGSGTFNLVSSGDYYEIALKDAGDGIVEGKFTISCQTDDGFSYNVEYPLYKSGYLHNLPSSAAEFQPEEDAGGYVRKSGWYYYEIVKCYEHKDLKVNEFYTTDRNIGADCNLPYISTNAALADDSGAVGGYFKISEEKGSKDEDKTVMSALGMASGFKIPEESRVTAMQIKGEALSGSTDKIAHLTIISGGGTIGSLLPGNTVWLPHGGYYDANVLRNPTHAHIWTCTLVSGSQGFSTESPEYGYWYRYYDFYKDLPNFSNMRVCNGSAGMVPDRETSAFKYMPVRPVWNP